MTIDKVRPPMSYPLALHDALRTALRRPRGEWVDVWQVPSLQNKRSFLRRCSSFARALEAYPHAQGAVLAEALLVHRIRFRMREDRMVQMRLAVDVSKIAAGAAKDMHGGG